MSDSTQDQTNAAMNNAKKELSNVSDYVTKECDKIGKLIDKCKKGYSKNMSDLEAALKSVTDSEEAVDDFINQVDNMEKYVKQTAGDADSKVKALKKVFSMLTTTGVGIREFMDCLNNNTEKLDDDLKDVLNVLNQTDGALDQLFTTVCNSTDNAAGAIDGVTKAVNDMIGKTGDSLDNLAEMVLAADKVAKDTTLGKHNPQKMFNDFRVILKAQEKELGDFVLKSGMDERTKKDIQNKMLEVRVELEEQQRLAEEGLMEYQSGRKRKGLAMMKKAETTAAAHIAGLKKYTDDMKKAQEDQKRIIDMAAGGFGRLAEETQNVSSSVSSGLHSLRNFNLVDAYKHFSQAWNTARDIHKAGNLVQGDMEKSKLARSFAGITKYMGYIAMLSTGVMAFISVLMQARDRAANLNKTLLEGQGLTGLGITVKSKFEYGEVGDQLEKIRGQIIGEAGHALDFAATADDVNAVIKALGEQGVTVKEMMSTGQDLRDATSGVFTYARLMGKSDTEMASLMGTIATNMSASMGEVEARFADMHSRWVGTRMSVDQFVGSIQEISSEHSMFGDNMNVVSKMLEATGKNSLLSSKQAMESTKTSSGLLKQMSLGKLRGLIEVSGGPQEVMRLAEVQAKDLERQLSERRARGDKETGPLQYQIKSLNGLIADYKAGRVGDIEYAQVLFKLNPAMGSSFLLKAAAKAVGLSQGEMSKLTQADIDSATGLGRRMAAILGLTDDQWQALVNQSFSVAGGPDQSLATAITKMEQVKGSIGDQTAQVTKNENDAKEASTHLITLEKLLTATTDQIFHLLYGKLLIIEKFIEKIVKLLSGDNKAEFAAGELKTLSAGFADKTPGTKAYYEQFQKIVSQFRKLREAGASPQQIQDAWNVLPPEFRKRVADYSETGDFKKLGLRGTETEQMFKDDPRLETNWGDEIKSLVHNVKEGKKVLSAAENQGSAYGVAAQNWKNAGVKPSEAAMSLGKNFMISSSGAVDNWSAFARDSSGKVISRERLGSSYANEIMSPATGSISSSGSGFVVIDSNGYRIKLTPTSGEFTNFKNGSIKVGDTFAHGSGAEVQVTKDGKEVGYEAFYRSLHASQQSDYARAFKKRRGEVAAALEKGTGGRGSQGVALENPAGSNDPVNQAIRGAMQLTGSDNLMELLYNFSLYKPLLEGATGAMGQAAEDLYKKGTSFLGSSLPQGTSVENNIRLDVDPRMVASELAKQKKRDVYLAHLKRELC